MKTVNYQQRKTFEKYDNASYLLYLNEQRITFVPDNVYQQKEVPGVNGYSYTGTTADGSTKIQAADVTDENRRNKFIAGLVGVKYGIDAQIAILANGTSTEKYISELADFEVYRVECKQQIDDLLSRF